jgi:hypothetical protein
MENIKNKNFRALTSEITTSTDGRKFAQWVWCPGVLIQQ